MPTLDYYRPPRREPRPSINWPAAISLSIAAVGVIGFSVTLILYVIFEALR